MRKSNPNAAKDSVTKGEGICYEIKGDFASCN